MIIHYCATCGERIAQAEIDAGNARVTEDRALCAKCAADAAPRRSSRRIEGRGARRSEAAIIPGRRTSPDVPSDRHRPLPSRHAGSLSSKLMLFGVVAVGLLAVVLAISFAATKTPSPATTRKRREAGPKTAPSRKPVLPDAGTKTGEPVPETPDGTKTKDGDGYDPRDAVAKIHLARAKEYAEKQPDDAWGYYAKLQAIIDGYARTKSADEAKRLQTELALTGKPPTNIAKHGKASSPDDLNSDGGSSGDAAAIDGDQTTYWDEVDNKKFYCLRVDFPEKVKVISIRIMGYQHHRHAPRDFDICCDDKVVKEVRGAVYTDNWFHTAVPETDCTSLELRITGSHGRSPAVRELEIIGWVVSAR